MFDLESITDPSFIKKLNRKELKLLCQEIREFLIDNISKTGGHLSSNLGVVEITVAMYYVFDPEKDKFIYDVGHQSYVHKILTGRAKDFKTLRQYDGLCGYISKAESKYDIWESGHSSTSISAMSGILYKNPDKDMRVVSLIGDSSIMNGVAIEGLNYLGQTDDRRAIIILNDNKMGISKSVGALSTAFSKLRGTRFSRGLRAVLTKILPRFFTRWFHQFKRGIKGFIQQDNIFEDMGFDYYGPYNGNDLDTAIKLFKRVKEAKAPVVLHFHTIKGKGYSKAEDDLVGNFHGVSPFDIETGKPLKVEDDKMSYSKLVADFLVHKRENTEFTVITPAMKVGAKLEEFQEKYPNDFIDVGIAEEHATIMSAGIATLNKNVVLLMYSTFSQRAYDEMLNDIARTNLKVIVGLDRSGIVGEDGSTHQGIYDVSMFMAMPNFKIFMGRNFQEVIGLYNLAFDIDSPVVIRYPRGKDLIKELDYSYKCEMKWEYLKKGSKLVVISYGPDVERILNIANENNLDITVIDAKIIKPIDEVTLNEVFKLNIPILVIEQLISVGTLYHFILDFKEMNDYKSKVVKYSFNYDTIIKHGSLNDVYSHYGFSSDKLLEFIKGEIKGD